MAEPDGEGRQHRSRRRPGGFYTQAQYADLVAYAAERFITVVPEIDMPGHTNAALSSYAELNCNGQAPPPFTGTEVGFSSLCVEKDFTYQFIDDVVQEIAALTPGPYFHMGGDEVKTLTPAQYRAFVERVQTIVQKHGKQMIGWDEVAAGDPAADVDRPALAAGRGAGGARARAAPDPVARQPHLPRHEVRRRHGARTELGRADPGEDRVRLGSGRARGRGAARRRSSASKRRSGPKRSRNMRDAEFMALPRLAAIAELGWSPRATHDWEGFRARLGAQGAALDGPGDQFLSRDPRSCRGSSRSSRPTTLGRQPFGLASPGGVPPRAPDTASTAWI